LKPKVSHTHLNKVLRGLFAVVALLWLCLLPDLLQAQANQNVVNGGLTKPIVFSALGCKYTWTNTDASIGLPAAGTGDIAAFTAINNGTAPIVATITGTTSPLGPSIYSIGANGIDVLDPITLQPINNIGVKTYGFLNASRDGNTLYFLTLNAGSFNIIGISTITNKVTVTIPTDHDVSPIISPDGNKLYLGFDNIINVFNTSTGAVESTINVGTRVDGRILSPDGKRLYVLPTPDNIVAVYNTATNALISNLTLPFRSASDILVTPDGNYLVLSDYQKAICITDTRSGTSTSVIIPGLLLPQFFISPDSKQLYVFCTDKPANKNYLYAVDIPSGAVTTIPTDLKTFSFLLTPDGKQIYLSDTETGKITVIDAATKAVKTDIKIDPDIPEVLFENGYRKSYTSLNYDGSLMYVASYSQSKSGILTTTVTEIDTKTNTIIKKDMPGSGGLISPPPPTGCSGSPIRFNITVYPDAPIIMASGTLPTMSTIYGTPSTSGSFTISGSKINIGILVTPPAGFEVSTDNINFADTVKVGPSPTVPLTQVYVRLKSSATVGTHSGDIVISNGPTSVSVPTAPSEVTAVPLTITANKITKTYGVTLTTALASTEFTSSGLKNNETIGSVVMNYATGSAATAIVGAYNGSATPSSATGDTFVVGNYTITYIPGNLEVTPALLTITADNKTRYFKEDNPTLTVTYSGFVNNETVAALTTPPVLSTTANIMSPVGAYPITATGATATNYTVLYKPGVLTILAKPVIITNAFTPNDDGINDTWDIKNISEYPGCTVEVFNRYGEKMFYSTGYAIPWAGKRNGTYLPVGTYYYIIKLDTTAKPLSGYLAIIR
jgi:gliding motility-associated-like protein